MLWTYNLLVQSPRHAGERAAAKTSLSNPYQQVWCCKSSYALQKQTLSTDTEAMCQWTAQQKSLTTHKMEGNWHMLETMKVTGNMVHSEFSCREENAKRIIICALSVMKQHGSVAKNSTLSLVLVSFIQWQIIGKNYDHSFLKSVFISAFA